MVSKQVMSQTGNLFGSDHVTLKENTVGLEDSIAKFKCPKDYKRVVFSGGSHSTRFIPRTKETHTPSVDGDISLEAVIQPIAGEEDLEDQPYPSVVVADGAGNQIEVLEVNYNTNSIVVDADDSAEVHVFPVITEGILRFKGIDNVGKEHGSIPALGMYVHQFADVEQNRKGTEIHVQGMIEVNPSDEIVLTFDSEHAVVWEDETYPLGQFVSTFEQDVDVY